MSVKKNDAELPNYFFQGQKMVSLQSKYILELYFRETVISLQKIIAFFANDVITYMKPIIITSLCNIILNALFYPKFEDLFIKKFGIPEIIIYMTAIIAWNIVSSILLSLKYYRTYSIMYYSLSVFIIVHMNVFLFMWILTPGTMTLFKIDIITLLFVIWNILGFGGFVILFPIPLLAKQIYITLFCIQISMFVTLMFPITHIWTVLVLQALWETVHSVIPFFQDTGLDLRNGFYFSNIHTTDSSLFINSTLSANLSNNVVQTNKTKEEEIYLPGTDIPSASLLKHRIPSHTDKAQLHFAETVDLTRQTSAAQIISNPSEGNISDGQYDEIFALKKLQDRCTQRLKQGINVRIMTLLFYNFLIVTVYNSKQFSASYSVVLVIAISFVVKEAAMLFLQRDIPIKLFVLVASFIIYNVVAMIVQPCLDIIIQTYKRPSVFD